MILSDHYIDKTRDIVLMTGETLHNRYGKADCASSKSQVVRR